jgi:cyclase
MRRLRRWRKSPVSKWRYTKGLKDIGNGVWAYLLPDGSWGWSNAGLIVDGDQTLLVDTLFDLRLTAEMLAEMRRSMRWLRSSEQFPRFDKCHSAGFEGCGNFMRRPRRVAG